MAVQQFLNKIEFALASPEVRKAFEDWKVQLEVLCGRNFPVGLGAPEDLAAQAMQGPPSGGMPPMPGEGGPGMGIPAGLMG